MHGVWDTVRVYSFKLCKLKSDWKWQLKQYMLNADLLVSLAY